MRSRRIAAVTLFLFAASTLVFAGSFTFTQTNLVSSVPGLAAATDPDLRNPWGISSSATSPLWVADNLTNVSTLYNTAGIKQGLIVSIPHGSPTGTVFNGSGQFSGDLFIFATEAGTIAGWRGALGTNAETLFDESGSGASYKGLAIATLGSDTYLYAADFSHNQITVFPQSGAPALTGNFTDPGLPAGFSAFNIQNLNGKLYVTYALNIAGDEQPGPGLGFVDVFDLNGNFLQRLVSSGPLNAPWGLAIAPVGFANFGGDLLVGNFGNGQINVFDATTGAFQGTLTDKNGNPLVNAGLWGLKFGNGGNGGDPDKLYFAAGINNEQDGLFGRIQAVSSTPEPGAFALAFSGLLVLGRKRKRPC